MQTDTMNATTDTTARERRRVNLRNASTRLNSVLEAVYAYHALAVKLYEIDKDTYCQMLIDAHGRIQQAQWLAHIAHAQVLTFSDTHPA